MKSPIKKVAYFGKILDTLVGVCYCCGVETSLEREIPSPIDCWCVVSLGVHPDVCSLRVLGMRLQVCGVSLRGPAHLGRAQGVLGKEQRDGQTECAGDSQVAR